MYKVFISKLQWKLYTKMHMYVHSLHASEANIRKVMQRIQATGCHPVFHKEEVDVYHPYASQSDAKMSVWAPAVKPILDVYVGTC